MNICQVAACRQLRPTNSRCDPASDSASGNLRNLQKLFHMTAPGLVSNLFEFLLGVQMLGINVLLTEAALTCFNLAVFS